MCQTLRIQLGAKERSSPSWDSRSSGETDDKKVNKQTKNTSSSAMGEKKPRKSKEESEMFSIEWLGKASQMVLFKLKKN